MTNNKAAAAEQVEATQIDITDFLVNTAPNKSTVVSDLLESNARPGNKYQIKHIQMMLPCNHRDCGGERKYDLSANSIKNYLDVGDVESGYLTFTCRNCGTSLKKYSILLEVENKLFCNVTKYGEVPEFGIYIEPEVQIIVGDYLDTFKKAIDCETKGYGIAAFAYYRRVIEDIKGTLYEKIIKVCEKIGAEQELIDGLKLAEKEQQFTNSVSKIKHGIPDSLYVNGHNPITLLHDALSEGLHNESDNECLEISHAIREILRSLLKNMDYALQEDKKLKDSVTSLLKKRKARVDAKKQ